MSGPTISVVLPVLDGERWLDQALDSIAAQTLMPDQVIVVDDGSQDRSHEIAATRRFVTIVNGPESGIVGAYNAGIEAATGDSVGFLGQDDIYAPTALEYLGGALSAAPDAAFACGRVQLFTDESNAFSGLRTDRLARTYRARVPEAVLIRRKVFETVRILEESAGSWDVDLFLRLDEAGFVMAEVDSEVVSKRLRPGSTIHDPAGRVQSEMLASLRRSLVRRREQGTT